MKVAALFTNIFWNNTYAHQHAEHDAAKTNSEETFKACCNNERGNNYLRGTHVSCCP